ncbi:MAG TPA: hypothetical protein VM243_18090 [Phycisphaerae bacterium]|nr:hypothetical protein [Phycisphaerae bacterium]
MTQARCQWIGRVRSGARLLFWVVLVSVLATNVGAMGVAFLGGSRGDLRWVAFIPAAAGFLLLVGVYLLTAPVPHRGLSASPETQRRLLRICAIAVVIGRCGRLFVRHAPSFPGTSFVWIGESLVQALGILLLFLYLGGLASRFREAGLARSMFVLAWVGPIVSLLLSFTLAYIYQDLGLSRSMHLVLSIVRLSLGLVVWIGALWLMWRFGTRIPAAAEGRCVNCGYSLHGLRDPRCPECGAPWEAASGQPVQ